MGAYRNVRVLLPAMIVARSDGVDFLGGCWPEFGDDRISANDACSSAYIFCSSRAMNVASRDEDEDDEGI